MGQTSSAPAVPHHKPRNHPSVSSFRGIRSALLPRRNHTSQSLSATFNAVDTDLKLNQLNVNTATEEELMTLPGINRTIAHSIVEYRRKIGRFNKPEDLALVSGVGAEKLALIRPEICVRKRATDHGSIGSSHASSMESLEPASFTIAPPPSPSPSSNSIVRPAVNINTANVFELMTVRGLTQETAAAIVEYRNRRGLYRSIDQLTKVKGMNNWKLSGIRSQVTIESEPILNGAAVIPKLNGLKPGVSTSPSAPNGFLTPKDIYEILSPMCSRPHFKQDNKDFTNLIRVASWCLGPDFTAAKSGNLGVQEIICRTILENRFSIISLQGTPDDLAVKKICSELNYPKLQKVSEWKINNKAWKCSILTTQNKAGLSFLYDSHLVQLISPPAEINTTGAIDDSILNLPDGISAVLAEFAIAESDVIISILNVSVDLKLLNSTPVTAEFVEKALSQRLGEKPRNLLILGDFTGLALGPTEENNQNLQYRSVLPPSTNTSSSGQVSFRDNIFLGKHAQHISTGTGGAIRQGLNHLAIPRDWEWGGFASEHCPLWCEFNTK